MSVCGEEQTPNNELEQVRSQKSAMGAVLGVWGRSPHPPKANGGLGAKLPAAGGLWGKPPAAGGTEVMGRSPSARKFCIFLQKQLHFRAVLIKK